MKRLQKYKRSILIVALIFIISGGLFVKTTYFNKSICFDNYIDWDIAVTALSQHFKKLAQDNSDVDFGPVEIERHFEENCEEDLKIYYSYINEKKSVEDKFKSEEFLGCENYLFDPKIEKVDNETFHLMEEKKYEEVINLGNKHLKDDGIWYCDTYFWTQRATAYYNLGNCYQAIVASGHNLIIYPKDNNIDDRAKELNSFITNSDICVTRY